MLMHVITVSRCRVKRSIGMKPSIKQCEGKVEAEVGKIRLACKGEASPGILSLLIGGESKPGMSSFYKSTSKPHMLMHRSIQMH